MERVSSQIKDRLKKYTQDDYLLDELTQLVQIKLIKYKNYNENQFKRLLGLICRSVYIDYLRSKKSEKIDFNLIVANIEDEIIKKEQQNYLFSLIDSLPQKQKEIVILRFYFRLNYRKICELMGVNKNTATSYMNYAKKNLKKLLIKNQ